MGWFDLDITARVSALWDFVHPFRHMDVWIGYYLLIVAS
jgi:hypothetical protein